MSRTHAEAPSNFPHWVALGSLAFVLWLFFSNTVPAFRERSALNALTADLTDLRGQYDAAIQEARLGLGPNAHFDLQALLVAIDQKGFTPAELCLTYPQRQAPPPHHDDPDEPPPNLPEAR